MRIFFLTGASIGVIGTVLGLILGIAFAANIETSAVLQRPDRHRSSIAEIYFLSQLPARSTGSRSRPGGRHGAGALLPGDALSGLAGGAARSGGGAAL